LSYVQYSTAAEVLLSTGPFLFIFYNGLHAMKKKAIIYPQLSLESVLSVFPFSLQHSLKASICTSMSALVSIPPPTARDQEAKQTGNTGRVANLFLALSPIPPFEKTIVKPRIFRCDYVIKPTLPPPSLWTVRESYLHIQYQIFFCP